MGCTPGGYQETAVIADGPDELTPAVLWKVLGLMPGDGFVDCVGMFGGFSPWLHVRLSPKMVNKINAIEYSGGTTTANLYCADQFSGFCPSPGTTNPFALACFRP